MCQKSYITFLSNVHTCTKNNNGACTCVHFFHLPVKLCMDLRVLYCTYSKERVTDCVTALSMNCPLQKALHNFSRKNLNLNNQSSNFSKQNMVSLCKVTTFFGK